MAARDRGADLLVAPAELDPVARASATSSGSTLSWALPKRSTHSTSATSAPSSSRGSGSTPGSSVSGSIGVAELVERHAVAEVGGGGGEDVAPGEGRARRREVVLGVGQLDRRGGAAAHGDRRRPAARCRGRRGRSGRRRPRPRPPGGRCRRPGRPPRARRPGTGTARPGRARGRRPRTSWGGMSWVRSMTATLGRDRADHRVHDADELVAGAVVGEEGDRVEAGRMASRRYGRSAARVAEAGLRGSASTSSSRIRYDLPIRSGAQLAGLDEPVHGHRRDSQLRRPPRPAVRNRGRAVDWPWKAPLLRRWAQGTHVWLLWPVGDVWRLGQRSAGRARWERAVAAATASRNAARTPRCSRTRSPAAVVPPGRGDRGPQRLGAVARRRRGGGPRRGGSGRRALR